MNDSSGPQMSSLITQALATFFFAWVVGVLAVEHKLYTMILIVFTLVLFIKANGLFSQKKRNVIAIEVGYLFAMAIIMILAQALL